MKWFRILAAKFTTGTATIVTVSILAIDLVINLPNYSNILDRDAARIAIPALPHIISDVCEITSTCLMPCIFAIVCKKNPFLWGFVPWLLLAPTVVTLLSLNSDPDGSASLSFLYGLMVAFGALIICAISASVGVVIRLVLERIALRRTPAAANPTVEPVAWPPAPLP